MSGLEKRKEKRGTSELTRRVSSFFPSLSLHFATADTAMERDRFMTPEESKAFGLVDNIQESRKMIGEEGEEKKDA